ncbi:glutathione S-transferase family protein [Lentilitoribacter sp. EG35]|uniref:glutathione S-transferase family protein n=1 Tax=Lentilitoribacter sp. EG35 TaxID=3234192 RepID=UPI003460CA6C
MLKVWGRRNSSNVQVVLWCIAELGLECEQYDIGHKFGGNDTPEYLAMNPNGTVPTFQDGDNQPLWESAAIVRYLGNAYGNEKIWPSDHAKRAHIDRWAEWARINVTLNFSQPVFWAAVRTPEKDRDPDAIKQAVTNFENQLRIAEEQLKRHDYLAGDDFTVADIQLGNLLYRYYNIDVERADLPALAAYYKCLSERPAYAEHVMVSFDDLRVT